MAEKSKFQEFFSTAQDALLEAATDAIKKTPVGQRAVESATNQAVGQTVRSDVVMYGAVAVVALIVYLMVRR